MHNLRISYDKDDDYIVAWICHSLSYPPSVSVFSITTYYYMLIALLVLEKSRCIIAESLTNVSHNNQDGCTFSVEFLSIEEKYQTFPVDKSRMLLWY
jgi:hypothetical protein